MAAAGPATPLQPRDDTADRLLALMSNPFALGASDSVVIAIGTALGITTAIFVLFLIVRPFNSTVYAPRLRYTDEKHRPPPMGKGLWGWWNPVFKHSEDQYVDTIGLDATIFLRFVRMCRNMFVVLSVVGCGVIVPINVTEGKKQQERVAKIGQEPNYDGFFLMTPDGLYGEILWLFVAIAYVFDFIICAFLWYNYRAVHRLRRRYLESPEYQNSLHSRTLMITDIPRDMRTDQGIVEITDSLRTTPEVPRASIGRNVKDIPDLIEEHEEAVMELEKVLAKYLKNPNSLPAERPLCRRSKKDPNFKNKEEKVDAITYLTDRIESLETRVKEARDLVDTRDAMPYGFASYESIESAHSVAYTAKNKHPKGTVVRLAPRPNDIIWKNLSMDKKTRRWRHFVNNLWITLLTILWCIPNALIAVFLSNLGNLASMWPAFQVEMLRNPKFWAVIQGVLAPAITSLFYYFLPIIFRRLSIKAGDLTKTSRERHVIHQLYSFFVFNNLFVFSLFAAAFTFVSAIIRDTKETGDGFLETLKRYDYFVAVISGLNGVSAFWVTWLVQRNLGAAVDLAQVVSLAWGSFSRKFLNPTPRKLIKRTAPPPFEYASYYNYFLFYATVTLCFAALQPVTLVVTAFYFTLDASMKKYLLLYVFGTKNESGGQYWRVVFNRVLVGTLLSNIIIGFLCGARGYGSKWKMLAAMIPLVLLLIGFKLYCKYTFDNSLKYYTKGETTKGTEAPALVDKESRKRDRVAVRFGAPALFQKLTVPMVSKKSQHLLAEVYRGRLDGDIGATSGFSDVYAMKRMTKENPGKESMADNAPFEFVSESDMDFENFKSRPEFANDAGVDGSVYGPISRPGTPSTVAMGGSHRGRSSSRDSERTYGPDEPGVIYPVGYHMTPSNLRAYSPNPDHQQQFGTVDNSYYQGRDDRAYSPNPDHQQQFGTVDNSYYQGRDDRGLLREAAPMGHQLHPTNSYSPYSPNRDGQQDYFGHQQR